jgi:hypothetical protein
MPARAQRSGVRRGRVTPPTGERPILALARGAGGSVRRHLPSSDSASPASRRRCSAVTTLERLLPISSAQSGIEASGVSRMALQSFSSSRSRAPRLRARWASVPLVSGLRAGGELARFGPTPFPLALVGGSTLVRPEGRASITGLWAGAASQTVRAAHANNSAMRALNHH